MNGKNGHQNGHSPQSSPVEESAAAPPAWSNVPASEQAALSQDIICSINDLSVEFGDRQHCRSNVSHVQRLYAHVSNHVDPTQFSELLRDLAKVAREAAVKRMNKDGSSNRMPYFFKLLDERITRLAAEWSKEDVIKQQFDDQVAKSTALSLMKRLLSREELDAFYDLPDDEYWAYLARFMPGGDCYAD